MREIINILMAALLFCGGAAMAASNTTDTRSFGSFDKLEVSRGIEIHVGCGSMAQAEISGAARDVSDITTEVNGHTLKISRSNHVVFGHDNTVSVRLTAPQPLVAISANTGVAAEVEACAVSPDHIDISANTGVTLDLAGSTGRAVIDANTGAEIRLCSVEHIDGNAALGANIVADSKGGTVRTSIGAAFSVESCK